MRVTNMLPDMQYQMQQTQEGLNTALQQISTGKRVNQLSDDPVAAARMVASLAESARVDQYTQTATSVVAQLNSADASLSAIVTSLKSAITLGTSGANSTNQAANRSAMAAEVRTILQSVVSQTNASYEGTYLFGGSVTDTPPFVAASSAYMSSKGTSSSPLNATTALTAGSVTTIGDASTGKTFTYRASAGDTIGTLQSKIADAVSNQTLSSGTTATIDSTTGHLEIKTADTTKGIAVTTDDAALGSMSAEAGTSVADAYAYIGDSAVSSIKIGDELSVPVNVTGDKLFAQSNVVGSLTGLIHALQSGTTTTIGAAVTAVDSALDSMGAQRVPLDSVINQVAAQENFLSTEKVTLASQQTSLVGMDMAEASTNLSQAVLANSTVLAAAAKVLPETLLDYLR